MNKEIIRTELNVINNKIGIMRVGNVDYISLIYLSFKKSRRRSNKDFFSLYSL